GVNLPEILFAQRGGRCLNVFAEASALFFDSTVGFISSSAFSSVTDSQVYCADLPPSMRYDAPVMNDALPDARNMMVWATSSGLPVLLSGTFAARLAFLSSVPVKRFSIPVSIGPGATMFTRTPDEAASSAADLVKPSTACLLAEYTAAPAAPVRP